jgi:short-subunit dehydrogenase
MTFANQVAIITGASSGIGHSLAKALAAERCKVGLIARRDQPLAELSVSIRQAGGVAAYATADVSRREPVVSAIRELASRLGPVDLLIANAGVGAPTVLEPFNVADIERMLQVNVAGVVYAVEAVLPEMLTRGRGHISAISSMAAYKGLPGEWGYSGSKAAVNNMMEGLRIQLRNKGIAVTTLCPGFVRTPMTEVNNFKMPWLLEANEAARRIVRALHRRRKVYNFPWQMSLLMRLSRWAPDWLVARMMRSYNEDPPFPRQPL